MKGWGKMYRFIYITTNLINKKKYIGQHTTDNLNDGYLGSGKLLHRAIEKYGIENFKREIVVYADSVKELDKLEMQYIEKFNACSSNDYYNIHVGGSGGNTILGYTKEEKEAFINKMKEVTSGERNGMYGKKHKEETIELLQDKRKEYYEQLPEEEMIKFKNKMREVTKGENNGMFGKNHSQKSRRKMSMNSKGKTLGERNGMHGKKGENAINGQKVYMYDLEWNLIKVFNTTLEALNFLETKGHTALIKACRQQKVYKGYYWRKDFSAKSDENRVV